MLHWNGSTWTQVPSPSPGRQSPHSVAAASADSAWAVGDNGSATGSRTLILQWNGNAWTTVPNPSPADGCAPSVAAAPARQRLGGRMDRRGQRHSPGR